MAAKRESRNVRAIDVTVLFSGVIWMLVLAIRNVDRQ